MAAQLNRPYVTARLFHSICFILGLHAGSTAIGQTLPSTTAKTPTTLPTVNLSKEVLNACDQLVVASTSTSVTSPKADPPVGMADNMPLQGYDLDRARFGYSLVVYPRSPIVDKDGNAALVAGEAVDIVVRMFAKDLSTLQQALARTQLQCLAGTTWTNRRALTTSDYKPPTNLRTYTNTGKTSCPQKTLPYYWTTIAVRVSPEVNDRRVRLSCDLAGSSVAELPLKFRTWRAVVADLKAPTADGDREVIFNIIAQPGLNATATKVAYNDAGGATSATHRATVAIATGAPRSINGKSMVALACRARLPFYRRYTDDAGVGRTEQVRDANDTSPVVVEAGKNVAYALVGVVADSYVPTEATFVMPKPLTFAILGDSFSAGEGAPDLGGQTPWLKKADDHVGDPNDAADCADCGVNCHRSRYSGGFRAVNQFIKESNKACDFVFAACSGAVSQDVWSQAQPSNRASDGVGAGLPSSPVQPKSQIDLARDWRDRHGYDRINCVVLGIGGNNAGFADVIKAALVCCGVDLVKGKAAAGLSFMGSQDCYPKLNSELISRLGMQKCVVLGYPDVVHGADGNVCLTDCAPQNAAHTLSADEVAYSVEFLNALNTRVKNAASSLGWKYADVFRATQNHGLCNCTEPYFNTWTVATGLTLQVGLDFVGVALLPSDLRGPCCYGNQASKLPTGPDGATCSFHPNESGYRAYAPTILSQMKSLYPN